MRRSLPELTMQEVGRATVAWLPLEPVGGQQTGGVEEAGVLGLIGVSEPEACVPALPVGVDVVARDLREVVRLREGTDGPKARIKKKSGEEK